MSDRRFSRSRRVVLLIAVVLMGAILIPGGVTQSTTVVSCARTALDLSHSVHCVATVFGFSPTGTVFFNAGGKGQVAFSPQWCILSSGTCQVVANGTSPGMVLTNASYLGDSNNFASGVGSLFNIYGAYAPGAGSVPLSYGGRSLTVFTVLMPPSVAVFPEAVVVGKPATLSLVSSFTGGTPPYTCVWTRLAPNATSFTRIGVPFSCTQASTKSSSTGPLNKLGVWLFELEVTDSSDEGPPTTVVSNPVGVEVLGPGAGFHAFSVSCQPSKVVLKAPSPFSKLPSTKCRATVVGNQPTGTVRFTSDAAGSFPVSVCHLTDGTCYVTYYPHATGSPTTITAVYNGNSRNPSANATTSFTVGMAASRTTVKCVPSRADADVKIRCIASVSGYGVGGTVTWRESGIGNVSFYSNTCVLASGTCSVVLSGVAAGIILVHAAYGGNALNGGSSGVASVTIRKIGS